MSGDVGMPISDGSVHAELVAIENAWSQAIVSNDTNRIAEFMADDWVIVSDSGVTSREDFLSVIQSGELIHSAMSPVGACRVRIYGETAVLTVRVISTAHYGGQRVAADEWTTDVFVWRNHRWLCVLTHITAVASA